MLDVSPVLDEAGIKDAVEPEAFIIVLPIAIIIYLLEVVTYSSVVVGCAYHLRTV
jgi:hypothetical protein